MTETKVRRYRPEECLLTRAPYVLATDYDVSEARRRNMEEGMLESVRIAAIERDALLTERDLLLTYYQAYSDHGIAHHCTCLISGCAACDAAHAYVVWKRTQDERGKFRFDEGGDGYE